MGHQPDNIPAGTQVVSSVPIRGTNDALVHPRGAVGIITRTPTGEQNHYLVRFPDGFVNPLTREEFDILKHFKDRVPGVASAPTDSPEFDLDQFVIYRCVSGSRAYGLETDDSDTDLRGNYFILLNWSELGRRPPMQPRLRAASNPPLSARAELLSRTRQMPRPSASSCVQVQSSYQSLRSSS